MFMILKRFTALSVVVVTGLLLTSHSNGQDNRWAFMLTKNVCADLEKSYEKLKQSYDETLKKRKESQWEVIREGIQFDHLSNWSRILKDALSKKLDSKIIEKLKEIHLLHRSTRESIEREIQNAFEEERTNILRIVDEYYLKQVWELLEIPMKEVLKDEIDFEVRETNQFNKLQGRSLQIKSVYVRGRENHVNHSSVYVVLGDEGVFVMVYSRLQTKRDNFATSSGFNLFTGETYGINEIGKEWNERTREETLSVLTLYDSLKWTGRASGGSVFDDNTDQVFFHRFKMPAICRALGNGRKFELPNENQAFKSSGIFPEPIEAIRLATLKSDQEKLKDLKEIRAIDAQALAENFEDDLEELRKYLTWVNSRVSVLNLGESVSELRNLITEYETFYSAVKKDFNDVLRRPQLAKKWGITEARKAETLDALTQIYGRRIRGLFIEYYLSILKPYSRVEKNETGKDLIVFNDSPEKPAAIRSYRSPDLLFTHAYGPSIQIPEGDVIHPARIEFHVTGGKCFLKVETGYKPAFEVQSVDIINGGFRNSKRSAKVGLAAELNLLSSKNNAENAVRLSWEFNEADYPFLLGGFRLKKLNERVSTRYISEDAGQPLLGESVALPYTARFVKKAIAKLNEENERWKTIREKRKSEEYIPRYQDELVLLSDFAKKFWERFEPKYQELDQKELQARLTRYQSAFEAFKKSKSSTPESRTLGRNLEILSNNLNLEMEDFLSENLNAIAIEVLDSMGIDFRVIQSYSMDRVPRLKINGNRKDGEYSYLPGEITFGAHEGVPLLMISSSMSYQEQIVHPDQLGSGSMTVAAAVGYNLLTGAPVGFDRNIDFKEKNSKQAELVRQFVDEFKKLYDKDEKEIAKEVKQLLKTSLESANRKARDADESRQIEESKKIEDLLRPMIEEALSLIPLGREITSDKIKVTYEARKSLKQKQYFGTNRFVLVVGQYKVDLLHFDRNMMRRSYLAKTKPMVEFSSERPIVKKSDVELALEISPFNPSNYIDGLIEANQKKIDELSKWK